METQKLVNIGGKLWNGSRIYFNNLPELYGMGMNYYNTGNVSSATLDGETISNSRASRILTTCQCGKLWYDIPSGQFCNKGIPENMFNCIVNKITEQVV